MKPTTTLAPMRFSRRKLSDEQLRALYEALLYPRLIEEKMLILLRQGRISKWFSGIGQEAIAVGLTQALSPEDYILPLHRNLGVFTSRGLPLERLMQQWLGKPDGYTQGRDRSFHFASLPERVIGMISHLGAMLPVANGLALASNLDQSDFIAVPFSGDGGTSEGDFHEALNVAAVWDLPVMFVIENNGYGLSTPSQEQFRCAQLADRAKGYGIKGYTIDGNNVLEVYHTVQRLAKKMRQDRKPILLECQTFRMRGHEEASGTKYVPEELFETWAQKDPVAQFEQYLSGLEVLTTEEISHLRSALKEQINAAVEQAFAADDLVPDLKKELAAVYAPAPSLPAPPPEQIPSRDLRLVDAVREGLQMAMQLHEGLVIMGQDVAEYGGVFKITEGFVAEFGRERVRNTPICESAIIGTGMGLSLAGRPAVIEMQFADFVSVGFNQIVNNLAKNHYRWGHAPNVVVRMPTGGGVGAGPYHSQSIEAWFTHVPGLKIVYPAFPGEAKGLLIAAIEDPNPVLYFEHKFLYRSVSGPVPEGYWATPIGEAQIVQPGESLSLVTYGLGVHWALAATEAHPGEVEIINLRTLQPWDRETVMASVRRTGKCLVLHEATRTGGFGAEIAAEIGEQCFEYLDGPVRRLAAEDTPVPFHPDLERQFLPQLRLAQTLADMLAY